MNLAEIIKLESCVIDLQAKDKDAALKNIAALFKRSIEDPKITQEMIYEGLSSREKLGSTGFANGIAMPHCQIEMLEKFYVSLAICPAGVDFDSIDHKKSKIFVSIIGPSGQQDSHLQLLAAFSRILREPGVANNLLKAKSRINLYEEMLMHADKNHGLTSYKGTDKLLMLFVLDDDIMDDITETFIEYGVQEAVVIDASNMDSLVSKVPLFMGFFNFTADKSFAAKVVLAKISADHINAITVGLEDVFGDLDNFAGLKLLAIDLFYSKGF